MLKLYRRHKKDCRHASMSYRRCACPVWVFGSLDGRRVRKSLDTVNWQHAEDLLRKMLYEAPAEELTVGQALDRFLEDCVARKLAEATLRKYRIFATDIKKSWESRLMASVTANDVAKLRESWKLSTVSTRKKLEWLRMFFRFAEGREWVKRNPATHVKSPTPKPSPTMPFTDEEMERILWALDMFKEKHPQTAPETLLKLRALILLMRHSGIRISDAVGLKRSELEKGKLFLYQAKTGTPVWIPLPKTAVDALNAIDDGGTYYFWSGRGKLKTMLTEWQERLKKACVIAGIPDGHAHRFRDTFACSLLLAGVPITEVSILLGHASVAVTEKHYAPWVKSRQVRLEELVKRTWV